MVTLRGTDTQPWGGPFPTCLEPEENPDADHVHIALTDVPTIDISIALQLALDYRSIGISRSITTRFMTTWYYGPGGMILSGGARDGFFSARDILEVSQPAVDWHDKIVGRFSWLRTALCEDMNSLVAVQR